MKLSAVLEFGKHLKFNIDPVEEKLIRASAPTQGLGPGNEAIPSLHARR